MNRSHFSDLAVRGGYGSLKQKVKQGAEGDGGGETHEREDEQGSMRWGQWENMHKEGKCWPATALTIWLRPEFTWLAFSQSQNKSQCSIFVISVVLSFKNTPNNWDVVSTFASLPPEAVARFISTCLLWSPIPGTSIKSFVKGEERNLWSFTKASWGFSKNNKVKKLLGIKNYDLALVHGSCMRLKRCRLHVLTVFMGWW